MNDMKQNKTDIFDYNTGIPEPNMYHIYLFIRGNYRNYLISTCSTKWILVISSYHKKRDVSFCELIKRTCYFNWNPIIKKCSLN